MMRRFVLGIFFLAGGMAVFPLVGRAQDTLTYDPVTESYTLTWEAVDPSTDTANVLYDVFFQFSSDPMVFVKRVSGTTFKVYPQNSGNYPSYGTYSFYVRSFDDVSLNQWWIFGRTWHFMSNPRRGDGKGTQVGHGQIWNVSFDLQAPANIYADITPVTTGVNPVKTLYQNVPRAGDVTFTWDCRDSSGVVVPNDMYTMTLTAVDYLGSTRAVSGVSIPVDIMRIIDMNATAITASAPEATINYTLSADSLVTILICKPGTNFTFAVASGSTPFLSGAYTLTYSTGDTVPVDSLGAISGTNLLRVMTFYRQHDRHSENWDGRDQGGNLVARGIYAYSLQAKDDYGRFAVGSSLNDGPIADTIPVDFTSPSSPGDPGGGGEEPPPGAVDASAPTISSVSPANGTTVTSVLSQVTATLADTGGSGVNGTASTIEVRNASGTLLSGTKSYDTGTGILSFTLASPLGLSQNGIYTVAVQAFDSAPVANYSAVSTVTFTLAIRDPNLLSSDYTPYTYPNPSKGASQVTLSFKTSGSYSVKLQIFNVLGELVREVALPSATGVQTYVWDLKNDSGDKVSSGVYVYRLLAEDGGNKSELIKRLVVTK